LWQVKFRSIGYVNFSDGHGVLRGYPDCHLLGGSEIDPEYGKKYLD
jgi:hypothetical protein